MTKSIALTSQENGAGMVTDSTLKNSEHVCAVSQSVLIVSFHQRWCSSSMSRKYALTCFTRDKRCDRGYPTTKINRRMTTSAYVLVEPVLQASHAPRRSPDATR